MHEQLQAYPARPSRSAKAVTTAAAEAMLSPLAEWKGEALTDAEASDVRRLLPGMIYSDAYDMAREFERAGWDANSELVDELESWDYTLHNAHIAAVREWIAANNVRPLLAVGAVVNVPHEKEMMGEVARVDEHEGTYLVRIDALGHVREGLGTHGRIFAWEIVEAATTSTEG